MAQEPGKGVRRSTSKKSGRLRSSEKIPKGKATKRSKHLRVARGRGRESKFTPEIRKQILEFLEIGNYKHEAARAAGINPSTLYEWLAIGLAPDARRQAPAYYEFSEAVKTAQAKARVRAVHAIASAFEDNWQAAAWYLERTRPQQWGRIERRPRGSDGALDASAASSPNNTVRVEVVYSNQPAAQNVDGEASPGAYSESDGATAVDTSSSTRSEEHAR